MAKQSQVSELQCVIDVMVEGDVNLTQAVEAAQAVWNARSRFRGMPEPMRIAGLLDLCDGLHYLQVARLVGGTLCAAAAWSYMDGAEIGGESETAILRR